MAEVNTTVMMNLIDTEGYFVGIFQAMNYYTANVFQYVLIMLIYLLFFIVLKQNNADSIKTLTTSAFGTFILSVFLIILGAIDKTSLVMILIMTAACIIYQSLSEE